jgi:DNA ligase-associated metallophosphoesterase
MKEIAIEFGGEKLLLCNTRAIFWPAQQTLILSDLHLGKSAHFRKNGIAIPKSVSENDISRLKILVEHFKARQLIIVGDLIHAGFNSDFESFKTWLLTHIDLKVTLVEGNHDKLSAEKLMQLGIHTVVKSEYIHPFVFCHEPVDQSPSSYLISGHLHPGVSLETPTNKRLKFPCFIVTPNLLILPAFSEFTGLDTENHPENAHYYIFTKDEILKL